ncbi:MULTISPECIES: phosphonate degradation HD-domain oxygenase [Cyanophyceae]|uniref:phosphonate degradation HD-domain oxygenase n=1 Tax=Cyanophyceae TaxID=3028117 RepID=UPI0016841644|nr:MULTISPECIES: phosphonate degradation HD-domain oxygenase [Cyanophyceae]MBD1915450.1 phosphohydrolase [Phormidium sp. FACHB-77]MBD2028521.1 phosphohydrolase [Phormidium sp. FACHB-322]MBD2051061.1 phosphohydrolase [Leptolyngbya sp. FACHB-60]
MPYTLATLLDLYRQRGQAQYGGEAVSQFEHALQCAALAEQAGQPPEMIAACLFHDLGHLVHHLGDDPALRGIDDRHEQRAIPVLEQIFPAAVTIPIQLHVAAKRYLCAVDEAYWDSLSATSKRSLELQGGVFSPAAATAFIQQPHAQQAVQLRRWDDLAKVPDQDTPDLEHFLPSLQKACQSADLR